MKNRPFTSQLLIISGFIVLLYMFFSLTTSIYKDYKLESEIERFGGEIDKLAAMAHTKPKDVDYFLSEEYKDRYAKENLNLLNPGEKLIIIPEDDQVVEKGPVVLESDRITPIAVLSLSYPEQWWEYFFGQTLSVKAPQKPITEDPPADPEAI